MLEILHALGAPTCDGCAERAAVVSEPVRLCEVCVQEWPDRLVPLATCPEGVSRGWWLGPYAGPVGALVRRAKYGRDGDSLVRLGRAVAAALGGAPVDHVVPVPSRWSSVLVRGFVSADLVARPVADAAGSPLARVLRRRWGAAQAGMGRRERVGTVRIGLRAPLRGRVLVVDDVITTGRTAAACATALLGAGADEVWLVAAARSGAG